MALSSIEQKNRVWILAWLLISAAAIRILAALNDLWLDEIWALTSVRKIASPWEVLTNIHLDNNHYLTSLWLYVCGGHGDWPGYRVPSIVAGVGCVVLAGIIARRRSVRAAMFAMFLAAFSYAQILYSSEARGYSEVVFFSFLSFYALEKYLETPRWLFALTFSVSAIFGFAAHLIFLNFYCAALLWSGWRFSKSGVGKTAVIKSMLACHAAPTAFFVMLYVVDIRQMIVGGGTPATLSGTYADSLAWAIGLPPRGCLRPIAVFFTAGLFLAGLRLLWRQRSDSWICFAGVVVVFPILLALIRHSDVIYVRYFIIGMAFCLVLFSYVLEALYQYGWQGRMLCAVLLTAYFLLNGWHTTTLLKYGRGHYSDAVTFLVQGTKGPEITIGTDHDFRVSLVLQFYADLATGDKTLKYYERNSWPRKGPEWVIYHKESIEEPIPTLTRITDSAGNRYDFVKTFPTAPLSGLHWFVYHNAAPAPSRS